MSASVGGGGGPAEPAANSGDGSGGGPARTVVINWVEHSHHRALVRVPLDFDPDECDLENSLAALSESSFEFLERAVTEVRDGEFDPQAEFFDPPRYQGTA